MIMVARHKKEAGCGECEGCTSTDCGQCTNCLDKKKFSGQGRKKQCCVRRRCKHLHVQTHNTHSAELNQDVPSLQKVLQDLSGTICMFVVKSNEYTVLTSSIFSQQR